MGQVTGLGVIFIAVSHGVAGNWEKNASGKSLPNLVKV